MKHRQRCYNGVRLLGDGASLRNIQKIDSGAMPMIASMASTGLQVDLSHFEKMDRELTRDMERITDDVESLTGHYCNIDSGDQVADLLFKKIGLKQARKKLTKTGDRESVIEEVLLAIQHDHEVIPMILEYKELSKLRGTYVRPMPKLAKRVSFGKWRMFPHFNTTRVPSGRLSCKDPNLLAMPTRTDRGREVRKGFITDPGWVFLSVDESQIEVRLAAHCSQDPNLVRVYQNDEDVYSDFATGAFRLKDERYHSPEKGKWIYPTVHKDDHRRPSKTCVLAAIYDVSPPGLLEQMPIICRNCRVEASKHRELSKSCPKFVSYWTEPMCADILTKFYLQYPGILTDRKKNHRIAKNKGYIYDMWGRLLHVAAIRSVLEWVASAALREVGNFPYQAGAQGTIKLTMAWVWDQLEQGLLEVCHPLLQVHDELLFECREDVAEEMGELATYGFENCVKLHVPIKAGVATASTWGDLEK